jgi:branched-chain amino acid transport system substrate-binding protein
MYLGLKFREAAANEAGSSGQAAVIAALRHARIDEGRGGRAVRAPEQQHARMNTHLARSNNGDFEFIESAGAIDPKECAQGTAQATESKGRP